MKFYYPKSHYKPHRTSVFPLLRPFIKGGNFSDEERVALYGVSEKDFEFTQTLEDADLAILTMAWNYYVKNKQTELAVNFIRECNALGIKVLTVNGGDFGVRIPYFENLVCLRFGGYKSKFSNNEFALPPFIEDPLVAHFNRKTIIERPYLQKPIIGFCGQANPSMINAGKEILKTVGRNLQYYFGLSVDEPQWMGSTSFLRASVLRNFQKSSEVTSNFILRKEYRAGVRLNRHSHKTTSDFYKNIMTSDYVVCIRGAGNFSVRFYETLALGRVPILINTNCALPFDEVIEWKKHVVWVEYSERSKVAEKVAHFHHGLSERDFIDLQQTNRNLWKKRLTLDGFFKNFL